MFEKFIKNFKFTESEPKKPENEIYTALPKQLYTLLNLYGGKSYENGLYRVHSFASSVHWSLMVAEYFSKYLSKVYPFGFDWMGRQFCMSVNNSSLLFMLDPGTGEDFELHQDLALLHNDDFVNDKEDMLASKLFDNALRKCNLKTISYKECIGYKVPLFLGGKDDIDNYEKVNLEVYWHVQNQLYKKSHDLQENTNIRSIKIE